MNQDQIFPLTGAFAGYVSDEGELLSCTSGGIATALSRQMLRRGGVVAGVAYAPDFYSARYEIIRREEELERLKGSKYMEVRKGTIYRDVKALLDGGTPVLFFGLPCAVSALNHVLGKPYPQLVTVALICHGPTYADVHRQYVIHLEQTFGSKIVDFTVRKKVTGWTPAYLRAEFASGEVYQQKFNDTEYGKTFYSLSKGGCYDCPFRRQPRQWDLTIGDFWGANEEDAFWNPGGVSAILTHTEKGLHVLKQIPDIRLFETTAQRIIAGNPCLVSRRPRKPKKEADV